jgi:hypothetical protein
MSARRAQRYKRQNCVITLTLRNNVCFRESLSVPSGAGLRQANEFFCGYE